MPIVQVTLDLPFYLRLEEPVTFAYRDVCTENQLSEFAEADVKVRFNRRAAPNIDRSGIGGRERTTVVIQATSIESLSDQSIGVFAINNSRELINRVITAYQAVTGEIDNAGLILPVGTGQMRLMAEIEIDGEDGRDRWPAVSVNTFPMDRGDVSRFEDFVSGKQTLPIANLFLTNASIQLAQGQYSLAVFLAASAVESRISAFVVTKLRELRERPPTISRYEKLPLGPKLDKSSGRIDSIETYLIDVEGYADLHERLKTRLNRGLRVPVVHHEHLSTLAEAIEAVQLAGEFLRASSQPQA